LLAKNVPGPCVGSISGQTCEGHQVAAGTAYFSASATYSCTSGDNSGCDFKFSSDVEVRDPFGGWLPYYDGGGDSWTDKCNDSNTYRWTGGLSGMPVNKYQLVCGFSDGNTWKYTYGPFNINY
jgi:hypothetical protein